MRCDPFWAGHSYDVPLQALTPLGRPTHAIDQLRDRPSGWALATPGHPCPSSLAPSRWLSSHSAGAPTQRLPQRCCLDPPTRR
eukprot:7377622-Prymnesium_polylepis.4